VRLLAPADFGAFAAAVALVALASSLALPAAPPADDAGWTAGLLRAGGAALLLAALAGPLAALCGVPHAVHVLRALALLPVIHAVATGPAVIEAAAHGVVALALAPFVGVWALVGGALAGAAAAAAAGRAAAAPRPRAVAWSLAARRLAPWGVAGGALVLAATDLALRAVLARRFGAGALGVYYVAAALALLPLGVAAELLAVTAQPRYAQLLGDPAALRRAARATSARLGTVLVPFYGLLAGLAAALTPAALGVLWLGAAPLLRVLAVAGAAGVVRVAAAPLFAALGRAQLVALMDGAALVAVLLLAPLLVATYGVTGAAWAWLGGAVAALLVGLWLLDRAGIRPFRDQGPRVAAFVGTGAAAGAAAFAVWAVLPGLPGLVSLAAGAAAGIVTAVVVQRAFERWLWIEPVG